MMDRWTHVDSILHASIVSYGIITLWITFMINDVVFMKQGAKQRLTDLEMKGKSLLQARKIRQFDENFDTKQFAQQALDIYIEAHVLLQE